MEYIKCADINEARSLIAQIDAAEGFGRPGMVTQTWAEPVETKDGVLVPWEPPPDRSDGIKPAAGGRNPRMMDGKERGELPKEESVGLSLDGADQT